jgi:hypothetical protein
MSEYLIDGTVVVSFSVRVPIPNNDPESWSDANCVQAFEAIAEQWDEELFPFVASTVAGNTLTSSTFMKWVKNRKFAPPRFWKLGNDAGGKWPRVKIY